MAPSTQTPGSSSGPRKRKRSKGRYSSFEEVVVALSDLAPSLPDARSSSHPARRYEMRDALLSAFSVFYFQHPSFLDAQRENQKRLGRNNASSIFGVFKIPTDPHIRRLLDPVPPSSVSSLIFDIGDSLREQGHLDSYRTSIGYLLVLDGTQTVSSDTISCPSCLFKRQTKDPDKVTYSHAAVTPVLVRPGEARVIALPPEFIAREDGQEKQDSEIKASTRWGEDWLERYSDWGRITVMGDDLYSREPFCRLVREKGCDFLFVCKESSHKTLYEYLKGSTTTVVKHRTEGVRKKKKITFTYRFMNDVPLNGQENALRGSWIELTVTEAGKTKPLFFNTWFTSHGVTVRNVEDLVLFGRSRWKIENENNNILKTQGYNLEHNFGHGERFLANTLATLNILSFLLHTAQEFWDPAYRTVRSLMPRWRLFQLMTTLTTFILFESFDQMMEVILSQGEVRYRLIPDTS